MKPVVERWKAVANRAAAKAAKSRQNRCRRCDRLPIERLAVIGQSGII
jgi:hypothetical protein